MSDQIEPNVESVTPPEARGVNFLTVADSNSLLGSGSRGLPSNDAANAVLRKFEVVGAQNRADAVADHAERGGNNTDAVNNSSDKSALTSTNASDRGHWITGQIGPDRYAPSASESNGFQAAQILSNPNATAADRARAERLIMSSPNPQTAVDTANNGYPVTPGFLGIGGTNTDSLSAHRMSVTLNNRAVEHPPIGQPSHANYRPGHTTYEPSGITFTPPPAPPPRVYPSISATRPR